MTDGGDYYPSNFDDVDDHDPHPLVGGSYANDTGEVVGNRYRPSRSGDGRGRSGPDDPSDLKGKSNYKTSVPFILLYNTCVTCAFLGLTAVLHTLFLEMKFTGRSADVLVACFMSISALLAVLGAVTGDIYLGKLRTLFLGTGFVLAALVLLVFSGILLVGTSEQVLFLIALVVFGVGQGFVTPCVPTFMGDQLEGYVEPEVTSRYFSILYWSFNIGGLVATFVFPIVQSEVSSTGLYCLTGSVVCLGLMLLFAGSKTYILVPPGAVSYGELFNVVRCARSAPPARDADGNEVDDHWLDRAKNEYPPDLVEDTKKFFKILRVLAPLPFFWMIFSQVFNLWIDQAEQLNRKVSEHWTIPAGSITALNPMFDIMIIPLFSKFLYPALHKMGYPFPPLQRMTAGLVMTVFVLLETALVQSVSTKDTSIAIMIPQFFLLSCAEILLSPTAFEFVFTEAPASIKVIVTTAWMLTMAFGNILLIFFSAIPFPSLAVASLVCALVMAILVLPAFVFLTRNYTYNSNHHNPATKEYDVIEEEYVQ